jgi:hypothetical protein
MLGFFLKYCVGGIIILALLGYLISLILYALPKIVVAVLLILFAVWVLRMFLKILKAEYEDHLRRKPFDDAMNEYNKLVLKSIRAEMRQSWTELKLAWANRKNRQ